MDVSVDRCYYHNDRPSVAVCSICGAGICQDCTANNNGQIVCVPCFNKLLKEDHREYLRQAKAAGGWKNKFTTAREFILPGIIGLILAVLGWVAAFHVGLHAVFDTREIPVNKGFQRFCSSGGSLFLCPFSGFQRLCPR